MFIMQSPLVKAWRILYYTYGLLPILAGLDKFFNILVDWHIYLHPAFSLYSPISEMHFMWAVGVIEIIAGLLVFLKPRWGSILVCLWLLLIALNILINNLSDHGYIHYDIAVRDVVMAVGAYALHLLSRELKK